MSMFMRNSFNFEALYGVPKFVGTVPEFWLTDRLIDLNKFKQKSIVV